MRVVSFRSLPQCLTNLAHAVSARLKLLLCAQNTVLAAETQADIKLAASRP